MRLHVWSVRCERKGMKVAIRLIVNADDFGYTRGVNEGIVEAHRDGILTATTLMANGAAFEHAVELARQNPALDVGCHLVLVEGQSVLDPARALPKTIGDTVLAVVGGRLSPYDELRAQVQKIVATGIRPTHLDAHKHTHLLPPVLEAVGRLAREFGIPWVRRPFDFGIDSRARVEKNLIGMGLRVLRPRFARVLSDLRMTDHFAGFLVTGTLGEK